MLVRKGVVYGVDFGHGFQNLLAHFVQGILDAWTAFCGKGLEGDGSSGLPRPVEFGNCRPHIVNTAERVPNPSAVDFSAQDSVVNVRQGSVVVLVKTVKR